MTSSDSCAAALLYRLAMASQAIVMWAISELDARALIAQFALTSPGGFLCAMTGALGVIGVIDVLINDLLPERFSWRSARNHRHLTLIALAFCYVAQLYINLRSFQSPGIAIFAIWNAVSLLSLAFVDAHQRKEAAHVPHPA